MIAIHISPKSYLTRYDRPNFGERWVQYCKDNLIDYKIVNAYGSDIIEQLDGCSSFMWNFTQNRFEDFLFAKQLFFVLNSKGVKTFPTIYDMWHFDDKVAQKYMFEALDIPHINTFVAYSKKDALAWLGTATLPKVFKLRGGAGAANVFCVDNKSQALCVIKKAFGRGFSLHNRVAVFKEKIRKYREGLDKLGLIKAFYFLFFKTPLSKSRGNEKGYVYFQDFVHNNDSDIRVVVVDNKAYAIKRLVRKNDFRASGSGAIVYDHKQIDLRCVKMAFEVSDKLNSSCINYDFIFDASNNPLIVEISYANSAAGYDKCEGFWDDELNWHQGNFNPYGWMVDMINK